MDKNNNFSIFHDYQFLSKERIEKIAEEILLEHNLSFPIDPTFLAEKLGLDTDIINLDNDSEQPIVAMLMPLENKIIINENHTNYNTSKGFEQSSIAHEIGHWELHINHKNLTQYQERKKQGLKVPQFPPLHRIYNERNLQNIEWQAQYFASCLLMPKFQLKKCLQYRNITNWKHLYAIADELGVTISNLTNRLEDLELIYIPKNSRQIYCGKKKIEEI